MYIVFFLLSRPPWKSAIAEGVSVNKYSFNNNKIIIIIIRSLKNRDKVALVVVGVCQI